MLDDHLRAAFFIAVCLFIAATGAERFSIGIDVFLDDIEIAAAIAAFIR
jgi:hypothetical protein